MVVFPLICSEMEFPVPLFFSPIFSEIGIDFVGYSIEYPLKTIPVLTFLKKIILLFLIFGEKFAPELLRKTLGKTCFNSILNMIPALSDSLPSISTYICSSSV